MSKDVKKKKDYSKSKMEIIRAYPDNDIIDMINSIKYSVARKELKKALEVYIPRDLKNNKSDTVKYGIKTKQAFVDGLKGCPKDVRKDRIEVFKDLSENIYTIMYRMYLQELFDNIEDLDNFSVEEILDEDSIDIFVELNKKEQCPKEYIENWYKFNPYIEPNKQIEKQIDDLTFTLTDAATKANIKEIKNLKQEITKLNAEIANKEKQIKEFKDIKNENISLKEQLKNKEEECQKFKNDNENLDDKLTDYASTNLDLEIRCKQKDDLVKDIESKNEELEKKYNNLQEKYEKLSNDKTMRIQNIDVQKMKESLDNKINVLEEKNKILEEENTSLKESEHAGGFCNSTDSDIQTYKDKINQLELSNERLIKTRISELYAKIQSDRKYQQVIMSLILNDSNAARLVIKHLGLKDAVIQEGYDYYDNLMIDKRIELNELTAQIKEMRNQKTELENEKRTVVSKQKEDIVPQQKISNSKPKIKLYSYNPIAKFNGNISFKIFERRLAKFYTNDNLNIAQNYFRKIAGEGSFVIVDNDKFLKAFDLKNLGIDICRVCVEPNWHGKDDWFGKFENGEFIPAKTQIADYYAFVKRTKKLPFGFVVFDNFNIIPPEIYIQSFIENMVHNGYDNVLHPNIAEGHEFAKIERLPNLKYIFIKCQDSDMAFDIPKGLQKYELREVK